MPWSSATGTTAIDSGGDLTRERHDCGRANAAEALFVSIFGGDGEVLGWGIWRFEVGACKGDVPGGTGVSERGVGDEGGGRGAPEEEVAETVVGDVGEGEA